MREASCYQTAPSTVDLFGNSIMSSGPAPCRCWVTAACSARKSSLCRGRQRTSIAWCGTRTGVAMRSTTSDRAFSVGWGSHPTQPDGFSCCSRSPPSTFTGDAGTSRLGRKSERVAASTGSPTGICRASGDKKCIGPIASVTIARLEEIAGELERGAQ